MLLYSIINPFMQLTYLHGTSCRFRRKVALLRDTFWPVRLTWKVFHLYGLCCASSSCCCRYKRNYLQWYILFYYRPQTKFAKVMFLQVSVCPHGGHAWLLHGVCVVAPRGGMRGCCWGDAWLLWGACMGYDEIQRYDQWAGGTHPTGMHSCTSLCIDKSRLLFGGNEVHFVIGRTFQHSRQWQDMLVEIIILTTS